MAGLKVVLAIILFVEYLEAQLPLGSVIIYRHGDSEPSLEKEGSRHQSIPPWPLGSNQLTTEGMKDMYDSGRSLRHEYGHLLGNVFDPWEIQVRSTDTDRTIMSAQALLAGLYPMKIDWMFNEDIKWRPVPINIVPVLKDYMLIMSQPCPKQVKLISDFVITNTYKRFLEEYDWVRLHVENSTGFEIEPDFLVDLTYLLDVLKTEEFRKIPLPNWTKSIYPDKLLEIANFTYFIQTRTPELARLVIGEAVAKISDDLANMEKGFMSQKVMIYVAHDITIANLLHGMRLRSYGWPKVGSYLKFDLVRGPVDIEVHVIYQGNRIPVPNCGFACPLSEFLQVYKSMRMDDRREEACRVEPDTNLQSKIKDWRRREDKKKRDQKARAAFILANIKQSYQYRFNFGIG